LEVLALAVEVPALARGLERDLRIDDWGRRRARLVDELCARLQCEASLEIVAQLADVARPCVTGEVREEIRRRQALDFGIRGIEALEDRLEPEIDVLRSVSAPRQTGT